VIAAAVTYRLIKKGVKLNWIILGIIVISWICAAFGILGVAPAA
jgi:PTS system mannose-specific IID component